MFSEASKITVAKLTKHFTVLHCTAKDCIASQFPGIKKWTSNHNVLAPHVWTDTFKLIGDKSISPLARDALAKVVHRTYVPTAARAITLNFRPYMPCVSCTESGCLNPPLYDHEHAFTFVSRDYEILDNCKQFNFTYFWSLFHIRCWLQLTLLNHNLYSWWV